MDMDKDKQIIEDVEVEWTSSDSSDSSSDDEDSRFEHELLHNRKGAETSNEASKRNRPTTTSGAEVLSIPPII